MNQHSMLESCELLCFQHNVKFEAENAERRGWEEAQQGLREQPESEESAIGDQETLPALNREI